MEEPTEPSPEEQQPVEDVEGVEEDEDEEEVQEEQNSGTESETQESETTEANKEEKEESDMATETNTTTTTNTEQEEEDAASDRVRPLTPVENMDVDAEKEKRVAESPVSVSAASDISTASRPNKRKRKGTAPTRHVQQSDGEQQKENELNDEDANSEGEFGSAYNEIDRANNRKLLEEFETKSDAEVHSRPPSVPASTLHHAVVPPPKQTVRPQKYGPPRLDLFGPPQHYLDLFGPPVRESTDNCSVVIRGVGEEELYCGPGDKDPGDLMIPLRSNF